MVTHIPGQARTRLLTLGLVALTLGAEPASARQWSAVCSNLSGVRVDDEVAEPTFTQDAVKGASWAYSWNTDTKKAILTLPASHASDGRSHKQEGVVSSHRGKDELGATVCQMAYNGRGLGELKRKREAADLIISAVNARG